MNTRKFTWSRLAAASIIALGIAVLWGTLVMWTGSWMAGLWQPMDGIYEHVVVTMDGTPVIVSRSFPNYQDATYRTLDGDPLPQQREEWLTGASLPAPMKPPRLWETPIHWPARIAGVSDTQRPQKTWYVIRDDQPIGHAYLVGFDDVSKLRIGYIGRAGFRRTLPPKEGWFKLGRRRFDWQEGALATTGSMQLGGRPGTYFRASDQRVPGWLVFLIDGDRLLEIDLLNRSLRPIHESPDVVSVAGLLELQQPTAVRADGAPNAQDVALVAEPGASAGDNKTVTQIVLRTADRVIVLDPPTGTKREFALPEHVRDVALQVYAIGNDQLLLQSWNTQPTAQSEFIWLALDGSVIRRQDVTLANNLGFSEEAAVVMGTVAFPIPIGYLFGLFIGIPITMLQSNVVASYPAALARAFDFGWLGLPTAIVLGVVLAWWTYRLQRKYHRPATGVWTAFVLAFGWPAFLAYWLEHRRPKMETCYECGTVVPRDREACAACNALFPAAPPLGTEIFA